MFGSLSTHHNKKGVKTEKHSTTYYISINLGHWPCGLYELDIIYHKQAGLKNRNKDKEEQAGAELGNLSSSWDWGLIILHYINEQEILMARLTVTVLIIP